MTDIVELLRTRNGNPSGFGLGPVCDEAADQIEWLLAERERWAAVVSHAVRELTELDEATAQAQANALRELLTPSGGFKGHCPHGGTMSNETMKIGKIRYQRKPEGWVLVDAQRGS